MSESLIKDQSVLTKFSLDSSISILKAWIFDINVKTPGTVLVTGDYITGLLIDNDLMCKHVCFNAYVRLENAIDTLKSLKIKDSPFVSGNDDNFVIKHKIGEISINIVIVDCEPIDFIYDNSLLTCCTLWFDGQNFGGKDVESTVNMKTSMINCTKRDKLFKYKDYGFVLDFNSKNIKDVPLERKAVLGIISILNILDLDVLSGVIYKNKCIDLLTSGITTDTSLESMCKLSSLVKFAKTKPGNNMSLKLLLKFIKNGYTFENLQLFMGDISNSIIITINMMTIYDYLSNIDHESISDVNYIYIISRKYINNRISTLLKTWLRCISQLTYKERIDDRGFSPEQAVYDVTDNYTPVLLE
jgi:hypothetical protein